MLPFLSSLIPGQDHARYLVERLKRFALLSGLSDGAIRRLVAEARWFGLPGGARLKRDSENETALFLVITGSLGIMVEHAGSRRLIAQVPPGETVGEVSLFTEEHSAEIVALRDSELLRIGPQSFEALVAKHPRVMIDMMRVMARRLLETTRAPREHTKPKAFAIVPLQEGLGSEPVAHRIAAALVDMGAKAAVLDVSAAGQSAEWFHTFEAAHDVVFYRGDAPGSAWSEACIRQADRVYLFARAEQPLPRGVIRTAKERICGRPELLLLHTRGSGGELPEHFALKSDLFETHHHIRQGRSGDIGRLARCVAGRAVGLVLGGGGARGLAHIGVIKALEEAGVPFDYLGGASMGAIVAAGLAAEWSREELADRLRAAFVTAKPLSDYTLPLIALMRGSKMTELLRTHFGSLRIEDLARPYFCISSDLTTGRIHEHCTGYLWRALRASAALPGIVPPVNAHGHLLVDGGVMNNLPVDLMRARRIGPLIASDVTGEIDFSVRDNRYGERPVWRLIWQRMRGTPSIFDVLMRSGTVGSEAQRRLVRDEADFLFEPPLENLDPLDFKSFDRAVQEGYDHAARMIDKHGVPLTTLWCEGPAVAVPQR